MILIWGSKSIKKNEGKVKLHSCPLCQLPRLSLLSVRSWFTFFFIPIFPTSSKKHYFVCSICENCFVVKDNVSVEKFLGEEERV